MAAGTALAKRGTVLRRPLALAFLAPLALTTLSGDAAAGGAWLPGGGQAPVEQRVAVAVGPARTTLWTSLRFDGAAGPVAIVVPVPPLSALDLSSDAWFEALEVASAPRVFPAEGLSPYCPGEGGDPDPLHIAGDLAHTQTLGPAEVIVLDDAGAVALWAAANGLELAPETASALGAIQGKRFVAARFTAPGGEAVTRTLRVTLPAADPALPLALTRADAGDLLVTTWLLGAGQGDLVDATPAIVPGPSLTWNAATLETDYLEERMTALEVAGPGGALLECASHESLSHNVAISGSHTIDGVITTYFEHAAAYGDASGDPAACTALAASALSSASAVATSCPRADHGVVDGADTCVEAPQPGETDPEKLRCGEKADDLAVGLSGISGAGAWLARYTLRIPAGQSGADWAVEFGPAAPQSPVLQAGSVSVAECGSGTGTGTGTGTGSGSGTGSGDGAGGVYYYDDGYSSGYAGCSCSGTADTYSSDDDGCSGDSSDSYAGDDSDDSCSGDSSDTSSSSDDSCSGDSSDSYEGGEDDSCSGDSSDTSSGSDDCSGDTSDSGYDGETCDSGGDSAGGGDCSGDSAGGSSDGCSGGSSGGSGDASCSGGSSSSSGDCSIASEGRQGLRKRRGPKLSAMLLGFMGVLAPIRRALRPRRRRSKS